MKLKVVLLFFSWPLFMVNGQQSVTLQQCYRWVEENYPQVRQYKLIDQAEQYSLSNASKSWLPQLALNAKASYQSDVTRLPLDLGQLPVDLSIPTLSKDQYQVAAEISQTIWDGGATGSARAISREEAEASRKQLESEMYRIKERINQLYFGCLLQGELLRQNSLLQNELRINLNRVRSMIANGMANDSDRESLEVELLNVQQRATEIEASRRAYLRMLANFTGQEGLEQSVLEKPVLPSAAQSLVINRPELAAFEAQGQYIESRNKSITAGLMPRFGAFVQAGYGRPGLNMLEDKFDAFYIAGIRMNWNLGRLYTLKNDRRQVEVARRKVDVNQETFLFNTRMQLISQDEEIGKLAGIMRSDDEIIRLRQNVKKAAEVKQQNGVISVSDLIREINAEDMARQAAAIHRTQHLMAVYQLMYITNNEQ